MTRPIGRGGGSRWDLSRVLLIAGIVVAIIAVVSWLTVGSESGGGNSHHATPGGNCRLPHHAKSGTEPAPALVATIATAFGAPDVRFTETSGSTTVYGYCFDLVDGKKLATALSILHQQPYNAAPGHDPTHQINFTKKGETPYGVSLSVGGGLDVRHPVDDTHGPLSIVWTDRKPAD
jgi:hypothetical protein